MSAHILIVDADAAFAAMIAQGLETLAGYRTTVAASGQDALRKFNHAEPVDVVILDLGTADIAPAALIEALRAQAPGLPVLVIPVEGDGAPPALPVQGVFTKPPFLPDLPPLIARVLGHESSAFGASGAWSDDVARTEDGLIREADPASNLLPARPLNGRHRVIAQTHDRERAMVVQAYPGLHLARSARNELKQRLSQLSQTLDSVPVLLTRSSQLLARAGAINEREARQIARAIDRAWPANGASGVSQEMIRFEEFLHPDAFDPFTVYSTVIAERYFLSAAWRGRLPLARMRQELREAAREIARLL